MDPASEGLMKSTLHDLANTLSGIKGILELSNLQVPLSPRDQARLEAIIADGMIALERSRHLALCTYPESIIESGVDWRNQLTQMVKPMGTLFRRNFEVLYEGDPLYDRWPGNILREYVHAVSRQILPFVMQDTLILRCQAEPKSWTLCWPQALEIPDSLTATLESHPRDLSSRWAQYIQKRLSIALSVNSGGLLAKIPSIK